MKSSSRTLLVVFCSSLFCWATPSAVMAQSNATVTPSFHAKAETEAAVRPAETTVTGTIQQVLTKHTAGSPAGLRLVVAGPQGIVNASVGPYLTPAVKQSLATGKQIQAVGVVRTVNGQNFFYVRQLSVGNQQVTVRNELGYLVYPLDNSQRHSRPKLSETGAQGDVR